MPVTPKMNDGPKRRTLRKRAKVSLRGLAREMEISPQYLLDLERGRRTWSVDLLERHDYALTLALAKKNPSLGKP